VPLPPWLAQHAGRHLGALVDHTLLRPEAGEADLLLLCDQAEEHGFGAVCVNGQWVSLVARRLAGAGRVRTVAVAGFPLGASGGAQKAVETRLAVSDGAHEVDVVQPLGWVKAGRWDQVREELGLVVQAARGRPVKVILETAALTEAEIVTSCQVACDAGAALVKTSTGFHPAGGATAEAVALMRRAVGLEVGVKASGGIRTPVDAVRMLKAGADRIGASGAAGWAATLGPDAPTLADLLG